MTFQVGQKVVCVRGPYSSWNWPGRQDAAVGETYTIRGFTGASRPELGAGLLLEEIKNPCGYSGEEAGFYSSRFRPIVERKTEVSFTAGADPSTDQFDNRRKVRVRV